MRRAQRSRIAPVNSQFKNCSQFNTCSQFKNCQFSNQLSTQQRRVPVVAVPFSREAALVSQFVHSMPKAEIHVHLEGTIEPHTALELARRHDQLRGLPAQDEEGLRRWFQFVDFPHFVEIYLTIQDLIRTSADFELIVYECGADMARQNIRYRELTVTTFTHTDLQNKGLTIDDVLLGLDAGRQRALADFGVEMRWIFDVPRHVCFSQESGAFDPRAAEITLEHALAGRSHGVVGLGLGGIEVGSPPEPFRDVFARAVDEGLLSVPHAGETVGPESIWGAVTALQAHRIGHGVRAIEDPGLLQYLRDRQIPLELNPTSNVCLHVYPNIGMHPLPHLDRMGLMITVNSDDPPLFNTNLCQEYQLLVDRFAYSHQDIVRLARNAFVSSGAEPPVKERLLAEFDAWVAGMDGG